MDSKETKHVHNQEETSKLRDLARYMSEIGCGHDILIWAMVAGLSEDKADADHFLGIVRDFRDNPLKAESLMVLIRLLLEFENFDLARQFAADLYHLEHDFLHTLARAKIASTTKDQEDCALAADLVLELLETHRTK